MAEPRGPFEIATERLRIRAWQPGDLGTYHALCNDASVMATMGPLRPLAECADYIARQEAWQESLGFCNWVVERRAQPGLIGTCGIKPAREGMPNAGEIEIGWMLAHECWGQGYASEAARAVLAWVWGHLAVDSVSAVTSTGNMASRKVMERIGMAYVAGADFDHPHIPASDRLRAHVLYRIHRP